MLSLTDSSFWLAIWYSILSVGASSLLQALLGEIQNDPSIAPLPGLLQTYFFFLSPCRKPVLVVQNGSKSASCFKGARRLHLNTQSLPPGHPYTVAGLGFIKTMPESSFQAPGGEPRCRELRKGKTWFFQDRFSHIKDSRKRRISFNSYLFLKEQSLFKISHDV